MLRHYRTWTLPFKTRRVSQFFNVNLLELVIDQKADPTWLYVTAIIVGLVIVAISIFVLLHYRTERNTNKQATEQRERGVE